MMYILAAGSPTSKVGPELYYNMGKLLGSYKMIYILEGGIIPFYTPIFSCMV